MTKSLTYSETQLSFMLERASAVARMQDAWQQQQLTDTRGRTAHGLREGSGRA